MSDQIRYEWPTTCTAKDTAVHEPVETQDMISMGRLNGHEELIPGETRIRCAHCGQQPTPYRIVRDTPERPSPTVDNGSDVG